MAHISRSIAGEMTVCIAPEAVCGAAGRNASAMLPRQPGLCREGCRTGKSRTGGGRPVRDLPVSVPAALESAIRIMRQRNPAKEALAARPGGKWVPQIDAMPEDACDAASGATPTRDHLASGPACARRGWPCLMEKPIADSPAHGAQLAGAFKARDLALRVGHHRRCLRFVGKARKFSTHGCRAIWWCIHHQGGVNAAGIIKTV